MSAIGDDVVDLGDAETGEGAQHPHFDARVFAPCELEQMAAAKDPRHRRWVLWAAKEAAYKAARQMDPRVVFAPRRFVVTLQAGSRAWVRHDRVGFVVDLEGGPELVHAVARPEKGPPRDDGARGRGPRRAGLLLAGVASLGAARAFGDGRAPFSAVDGPSRPARPLAGGAGPGGAGRGGGRRPGRAG